MNEFKRLVAISGALALAAWTSSVSAGLMSGASKSPLAPATSITNYDEGIPAALPIWGYFTSTGGLPGGTFGIDPLVLPSNYPEAIDNAGAAHVSYTPVRYAEINDDGL